MTRDGARPYEGFVKGYWWTLSASCEATSIATSKSTRLSAILLSCDGVDGSTLPSSSALMADI